jgi:signal transduction histidine kinase
VLDLIEEKNVDLALNKAEAVENEENQFNKQLEGVLVRHEMFTEALIKVVEEEEVLSMKMITIITLIFVVIVLVGVFTFAYNIWRPLNDIRLGAMKLGSGDLNARVKIRNNSITEDIVDTFNNMATDLQDAHQEIKRFMDFSFSTAYDLNSPVKNLGSLLNLLEKEGMNSSNFQPILRNAKRTTQQLESTIESLNEVNTLRERMDDPKELLSLDEQLNITVKNLKEEIASTGTSIKKDFKACNKVIYPPLHLQKVLFHLLQNAIRYSHPERKPVIRIKSTLYQRRPILTFTDNGLGFDTIKHRNEIMKPFFRIHSHIEGSGMGLYLVKTIVDKHHGKIKIESKPKVGTRVTVELYQSV